MLLLIGLALFTPKVFFSISLLFVNKYHYFVEAYKQMLLCFEKLKTAIFLTSDSYMNIDSVSKSLCKSFEGGPSYGNYCSAFLKYMQVFTSG